MLHPIIICPVCVKRGVGCGAVENYYGFNDPSDLHCLICGWKGTKDTCETYQPQYTTYQVVEIDLSVVGDLLNVALQGQYRVSIRTPSENATYKNCYYSGVLAGGECDLKEALGYLASHGWLPDAVFKVTIDA